MVDAGLSSRLSYTFSRTNESKTEDISGHTPWSTLPTDNRDDLRQLVKYITTGYTGTIAPVKSIVQYPLYMGLPATGDVLSILGAPAEIMKTVDLSWNYAGLSQICDDSHAGVSPHPDQICVAGEAYRNASFGADLGWFTLNGTCDVSGYEGLCLILANDKISVSENGFLSTLLDKMDSGKRSLDP